MKKETYYIEVGITDQDGNVIRDENGTKVHGISYSLSIKSDNIKDTMQAILTDDHRKLKACMPTHKIELIASVFNSISGTFIPMFAYYGPENRFVKFT
jgi:hypothetical protein